MNRIVRRNPSLKALRKGAREETLKVGGKYTTRLEAGDRVIIETPGGGGWGKP